MGSPGRSYYMDMEIKIDAPDMTTGNCNGQRRNFPTAQADMLFTSAELRGLCGFCRFACPGALLEQDPVDEEAPTPQSVCQEAGVDYNTADLKCQEVHAAAGENAENFVHESCIMDYCGSGGNPEVIEFENEFEHTMEEEDK